VGIREEQIVVFKLKKEKFGVGIEQVREIVRPSKTAIIPQAPDWLEGVVKLRQEIIPVIDLRNRFGLPRGGRDSDTRTVIAEIGDALIGLTVDAVEEVLRLSVDNIAPPPRITSGTSKFIKGIAKIADQLIILLDLNSLFLDEEIDDLSSVLAQIRAEEKTDGTVAEA